MMATATKAADIDVLSHRDAAAVVHATLDRLGITFDELAAQASLGHFDSIEARLAWLAIGGLYQR